MPKEKGKGKGQAMPKGKGKGKGKGKVKGKKSSVGSGSTYADPGRPKTFKPTDQDRRNTGNVAEYFLAANKGTAQPLAPVFARGPHSTTASTAVPSTQQTAPTTEHSTEVIDVDQAAEASAADGLACMLADYVSVYGAGRRRGG
jgi:hypothetical protein